MYFCFSILSYSCISCQYWNKFLFFHTMINQTVRTIYEYFAKYLVFTAIKIIILTLKQKSTCDRATRSEIVRRWDATVADRASKARRELPFRLRNSQKVGNDQLRSMDVRSFVRSICPCVCTQPIYRAQERAIARGLSPWIGRAHTRFPGISGIVESYLTFRGVRSFSTHPACVHSNRACLHWNLHWPKSAIGQFA